MSTTRQTAPPTTSSSSWVARATAYVVGLIRVRGPRYVAVSVVNVLLGGGLLVVLQRWLEPTVANVVAVGCSAVPAYYLNRAWVWGKRGRSHWRKEVLPFWAFVFTGLVLSTIAIAFAQQHTDNHFVILFVQLFAFGVLWVLRFFLLDKLFHIEVYEDDTPDEV